LIITIVEQILERGFEKIKQYTNYCRMESKKRIEYLFSVSIKASTQDFQNTSVRQQINPIVDNIILTTFDYM
jgi:hypothetical protein